MNLSNEEQTIIIDVNLRLLQDDEDLTEISNLIEAELNRIAVQMPGDRDEEDYLVVIEEEEADDFEEVEAPNVEYVEERYRIQCLSAAYDREGITDKTGRGKQVRYLALWRPQWDGPKHSA